jgi:hypothetical protein
MMSRNRKPVAAVGLVALVLGTSACAEYLKQMQAESAADEAAKKHMLEGAGAADGYDKVSDPPLTLRADAFKGKKAKICAPMWNPKLGATKGVNVGPDPGAQMHPKFVSAQNLGKLRSGFGYVTLNANVLVGIRGASADTAQSDAGDGQTICFWSDGDAESPFPALDIVYAVRWNSASEQRRREKFHQDFQKSQAPASAAPSASAPGGG